MKDEYRQEKLAIKQRVNEIISDYLISEPEEDVAVIAMYFRKGNEDQEKVLTFFRNNENGKTAEGMHFVSLSDLIKDTTRPWYETLLGPCDYCVTRNCGNYMTCERKKLSEETK